MSGHRDDICDADPEQEKSKSQRKREMHALQDLGKTLVELSKEQFEKIDLPEDLHDAILEARRIHQHGARKRQLQYIGKLMRSVDADALRDQVDTITGHSKQAVATLHHIERWRDRLLNDGDTALSELVSTFPETDRQYVRQLIRNGKKELLDNRPPKSVRGLFKYLRELIDEEGH